MMMRIFSVYDSKANAYGSPFFMPNQAMALRSFAAAALDKNSGIGQFPTDFTLFEIGTFDDSGGLIQPIEPFINHGLAASFIKG